MQIDTAKVGRHKINKKIGTVEAFDQQTLTRDDIVATIKYIVALHDGRAELETPAGTIPVEAIHARIRELNERADEALRQYAHVGTGTRG